jgi:hypothetical protein
MTSTACACQTRIRNPATFAFSTRKGRTYSLLIHQHRQHHQLFLSAREFHANMLLENDLCAAISTQALLEIQCPFCSVCSVASVLWANNICHQRNILIFPKPPCLWQIESGKQTIVAQVFGSRVCRDCRCPNLSLESSGCRDPRAHSGHCSLPPHIPQTTKGFHLSYLSSRSFRELLASMMRNGRINITLEGKRPSQNDVCSLLSANNCRNVRLCALEIPIGPYTFTKGRLAQCSGISYHIEIIASPFFPAEFLLLPYFVSFSVLPKFLSDSPDKNRYHGF